MTAALREMFGLSKHSGPVLACVACGVLAPEGNVITVDPRHDMRGREVNHPPLCFTRCADCEEVHAAAGRLLDAHPRVQGRIGAREIAVFRVESALYSLAAMKHPMPDSSTTDEGELTSLIDHLSTAGVAATFSRRFAPVMQLQVDPGDTLDPVNHASRTPWAHMPPDMAHTLRAALAMVLRQRLARTAPPVELAPPDGLPGCLFCGVGSFAVPATFVADHVNEQTAARAVWRRTTCDPTALGGRGSTALAGHLCQTCANAADRVGALGITAMEHALAAFCGPEIGAAMNDSVQIEGMLGWAVLGLPPGRTPWEFVNIDGIRSQLARRLRVG